MQCAAIKYTNTAPLSVIVRITKTVKVLTIQDNRLAQPPVSFCGADRSSASLFTAFSMTRCTVVPGEAFRGGAKPFDVIGKSIVMSVVNSRSGSVVLYSLQDLLPPAIVHNVLYCCPSKHLTGLWAGCCSLLDSAHCITSTRSQLHLQGLLFRSSILKSGTFSKARKEIVWRLLELRSKSYKPGRPEKVTE